MTSKARRLAHTFARGFCTLLLLGQVGWVHGAQRVRDVERVPHISDDGQHDFRVYARATSVRKAFAISPGGSWAWQTNGWSRERVASDVLARCNRRAALPCRLFAHGDEVVWQPRPEDEAGGSVAGRDGRYVQRAQRFQAATNIPTGFDVGERHPDFEMTAPDGSTRTLASMRGKVVVVSFVGSWCPYCQGEVAEMTAMYDRVGGRDDVEFIVISSGETAARTRTWSRQLGASYDIQDCGLSSKYNRSIRYADGSRRHASVPSRFVIDTNGVVVARYRALRSAYWPRFVGQVEALANFRS